MTLEELLVAATANGLTHVTLYPVHSEDRKTTYWHARATPSTGHQYVSANGTNPVDVLAQVLEGLPRAKKRTANPPFSQLSQREITATVNPVEEQHPVEKSQKLIPTTAADEEWMLK